MHKFQFQLTHLTVVMPGLDPGIHVLLTNIGSEKGGDGRDKPGHDACERWMRGAQASDAALRTALPAMTRMQHHTHYNFAASAAIARRSHA